MASRQHTSERETHPATAYRLLIIPPCALPDATMGGDLWSGVDLHHSELRPRQTGAVLRSAAVYPLLLLRHAADRERPRVVAPDALVHGSAGLGVDSVNAERRKHVLLFVGKIVCDYV